MTPETEVLPQSQTSAQADEALVAACLSGDQTAWATLVEKYRKLVYSVPVKYRLTPEDAADIFQAVWTDLVVELPSLRSPAAIRSWLMTVASHKCYHRKRSRQQREQQNGLDDIEAMSAAMSPQDFVEELEREQIVRDALELIPSRCRHMVKMLFYEHPPLPYKEVAERLGLAEGSIGFIRGRCLQKLRAQLEEMGF
jgi:RNA polymerase sigma factor (sigma-70 family)